MNKRLCPLLAIIADGNFYSGQELANRLCVSRAMIWKLIKQLTALGLEIEARHGKGYRLRCPIELLSECTIKHFLSTHAAQYHPEIETLFSTDSTNTYLLARSVTQSIHANVVLAEYQSHGQGRRGRQWLSPLGGGLYFSIGWHFNLNSTTPTLWSLYIGVAIVKGLNALGIHNAQLKWPNDILINNQKLGGILINIRGEVEGPLDVVVGVGINYNMPKAIALEASAPMTDLCCHSNHHLSRNQIAAALINSVFEILASVDLGKTAKLLGQWRQYDCYSGKQAMLIAQQNSIAGIVEGVDSQGALILNVDGKRQHYISGELSLRRQ